MGVHRRTRPLVGYGLDNALQSLAPQPIIAQRDPTTSDIAEIGSIWIHGATNSSWTLTSVVAGAANWEATTGGSGHFNSLTVGPGAFTVNSDEALLITTSFNDPNAIIISASGGGMELAALGGVGQDVNILCTNGSVNVTAGEAAADAIVLDASGAGGIELKSALATTITTTNAAVTVASGTGTIGISADAAATTVNIGTGGAAKAVTLGSTNSTSATTVQSGSGALNITSTGGALTIDSGVGTISVGSDASAGTVNLATGAAAKVVTLGSVSSSSSLTLKSPATAGVIISNGTQAPGIFVGTGSPSGSLTAPQGSLFLNVAGSGVNDRAFINTDAGTTWTAVVTVA